MDYAIYTVFFTLSMQYFFKEIFEHFIFAGKIGTNKFKKRVYPKEYSFKKRLFLLTYYDEELISKCEYKKQMRKVLIANRIYVVCGIVLSVLLFVLDFQDKDVHILVILSEIFMGLTAVFFFWFKAKGQYFEDWIRERFEPDTDLPDEENGGKADED